MRSTVRDVHLNRKIRVKLSEPNPSDSSGWRFGFLERAWARAWIGPDMVPLRREGDGCVAGALNVCILAYEISIRPIGANPIPARCRIDLNERRSCGVSRRHR